MDDKTNSNGVRLRDACVASGMNVRTNDDQLSDMLWNLAAAEYDRAIAARITELESELAAMQAEWLGTIAAVAVELAGAGFVDESGGDGIVIAVRDALAKQKVENERLRDRLATIGAYFGEDFTKP